MSDTTVGTTTTATSSTGTVLSKTSADLDLFLKLLTTQMQNQDPLEPMDSSEYTSQLVQYSEVEQSIKQSGTLEDILSRLTSQTMTQASSFVGQTAEFDYAVSGLSETAPAQWGYQASRAVDTLTATVKSASGKVVATRTLESDAVSGRFTWDGTLANGTRAADGAYTLSIAGTDASGNDVAVSIGSIGTISDVRSSNGAVTLGVNGVAIPIDKMVRLAAAS